MSDEGKRDIFEGSDRNTGIGAVLGEAAVHGDAMGLEILTEQFLASTAVEALAAKLGIVCADSFADFEAFDLRAHGGYHANSLMACCKDTVRLGSKRAAELMGRIFNETEHEGLGQDGTRNKRELYAVQKVSHLLQCPRIRGTDVWSTGKFSLRGDSRDE